MAIFLPLHVSESFPYSRGRLRLGVCQASMPSCMCLCGFRVFLGVSASWSLRLFLLFPLLGIPFPASPFGSPFLTFFSVREYNTHSFYHP